MAVAGVEGRTLASVNGSASSLTLLGRAADRTNADASTIVNEVELRPGELTPAEKSRRALAHLDSVFGSADGKQDLKNGGTNGTN